MADEEKDIIGEESEDEMGFLDHLEELRWRIVKAVVGIVLAAVLVGIFIDDIMKFIIFAPAKNTDPPLTIINLKPYGQFTLYMQVILIGGIILSVPNIIYQFWKFIEPALMPNERKYISGIVFFTSLCFIAGIVFAYFVLLPTSLGFFANFGTELISNQIDANEYMQFVISVCLLAGIVFELPMVSFFLSKVGILKPEFMKKYRKHAVVAILVIAAIMTPSPDVVSQIMLAIPLLILYEISIFICKAAQKKRENLEVDDDSIQTN
ncbi:MAG TPA: twin-arginine translocase subunit TatC [Ignavibacteria bacterium]|nr:twin-arginine translocase subunit TatC [Ignavibacteria bacterium]